MNNFKVPILVCLSLFYIYSCTDRHQSKSKEVSSNKISQSIQLSETDSLEIGYFDDCLTCRKLDPISSSYEEFSAVSDRLNAFEENSHSEDTFRLTFSNGKIVNIPLEKKTQSIGYKYEGFLPRSKCYVLSENSVVEHLNFNKLLLLNKQHLSRYYIVSVYSDEMVQGIVESPSGKFIAYYENEGESEIASHLRIIELNESGDKTDFLKEYAFLDSDDFLIRKIKWLDSTVLGVLVYHESNGISYYKIPLDK